MDDLGSYAPLYAGYAAALAAVVILLWVRPGTWPPREDDGIRRPWLELATLVVACVAVVAVGTAMGTMGLGRAGGRAEPVVDTALELLRFSPLILWAALTRPDRRSIWVSPHRPMLHVAIGVGLTMLGVGVYLLIAGRPPIAFASRVLESLEHDGLYPPALAVHVLAEDLAIALVAARLLAVCGNVPVVAVVVAGLFALAHLPAMLDGGVTAAEIASLVLDTGLGTAVLLTLVRTRDVLWFWPLHLVMDLTQFGS